MCEDVKRDKQLRWFKSILGINYLVKAKSCFFCQHCTDIYMDYTNGPYMFLCELDEDGEKVRSGLEGECEDFKEEE